MAKKLMMLFMVISMLLVFAIPVAAWEPNMDGGGGAIGGGGGGNVWHNGQDGLRVTFVNKVSGRAVTTPVDLTNGNFNGYTVLNFQGQGAKNKTYYAKDGGGLNYKTGDYKYYQFGTPIPKVIGSGSDINALRARFQDIGTIQGIVKKFIFEQNNTGGFSRWEDLYDFLANGDYTIMIEPIAYFYFNGNFWAMTATEAALYNTSISNGLHSKMGSLTQCLLPMSVLLSSDQCGYWVDQYVYSQRNNTNFRFSTNYGGYVNGDRQIVANGVGVGFLSNPSENVNQKPDLAVTSFVTDKSNYTPGETVKVTARVQNLGVASNAFTTSLKMTNGRWDGSDAIQVQRKDVSGLSNNSYADYEFYFTAPAEGTYSITITADCYAAIDESNENNNIRDVDITVAPPASAKPDLVITSLSSAKSSYYCNDTVTIDATVANYSNSDVGETYTSINAVNNSIGIQRVWTKALDAHESTTIRFYFPAPSVDSKTDLNLIATADCWSAVNEINENNNTATTSILIYPPSSANIPDLAVTQLATAAYMHPGDSNYVYITITNIATYQGYIKYPFSYAKIECIALGLNQDFKVSSTIPGYGEQPRNINITAPNVATRTEYTITVTADYYNNVAESNENNNKRTFTFVVDPTLPDLVITSLTTDKSYYNPGETISVTANIKNDSASPAKNSHHAVVPSWDEMKKNLLQADFGPGETKEMKFTIIAPNVSWDTNFDITCFADYKKYITESNENNNTATANVIVANPLPDLTITSLTTDKSTYNAGDTITVTSTVSNIGAGGSSGEHYVKVEDEPMRYFSSGVQGDGYVASGGRYVRTYTFTAPSVSSATNITLRTTVDYLNGISESNEDNNTKDISIMVKGTAPDLTITAKDYTYYTNTEVVTPANITSNKDILPDIKAKVFFNFINDAGEKHELCAKDAVCPGGKEQLVWSKWTTPNKPQKMTAKLIFEANGATATTTINITIIDLAEITPPDTTAEDERPLSFNPIPPAATTPENENSWKEWIYENNSFTEKTYTASLVGTVKIAPHSTVPTAKGDNMKSGYGIGLEGNTYIISDAPTDAVTSAGQGEVLFPEYLYKDYDRVLDVEYNWTGAISDFTFGENINALSNDKRVHFVPLWYPDGEYRIYTKYFAAYTPAGELKLTCSDTTTISGDLYDDWSVTPAHPTDLTR